MRLLILAIALAVTSPVFAQPAPEQSAPAECFPTCRAGYTCRGGTCVPESATTTPATPVALGGVLWGQESNAPGTGAQSLSANARPAPAPPKAPPRYEIAVMFGFDSLFFSSKNLAENTPEAMALDEGETFDHLNKSAPVELRIREGGTSMFFGIRLGWALIHNIDKYMSNTHAGNSSVALVVAQQIFRFPLARDSGPLVDRTLSIDLAIGGFYASPQIGGGMANLNLNFYWFGVGPQVAIGTETGVDVGLQVSSRIAF